MKEVYEYLKKEINFSENDAVVIGCSGGPDSMALLNILIDIRKNKKVLLVCAHVNHNVRKESKQEEEFLQEYCKDNNIVFETMTIEKYGEDNFHNEARKIRYQFFEEVINKYKAKYLMTAHHGDDLVETVLMRIVRGSSLKGYAGFEKKVVKDNYTLARPLIFVTKEELLQYNKRRKIPFVIDQSNFKGKYTRNRYRKEIMPFLKQEDPLVHNKFLKFSDTLIEYNDYINNVLSKEIKKVCKGTVINVPMFLANEMLIQKKLLFYVLERVYHDDLNQINMTHVLSIIKLMRSRRPNGSINLPGNYKAIKEYDKLKITQEVDYIGEYKIEIDKLVELPRGKMIKLVESEEKNDNNVCRLLSSEISMPLYVRTRKLGDKMSLKRINGMRKIKDIFIDKKVPITLRDDWPIVVDSKDNILWIPGIKKSKFSKQKSEKCDIILKYN